MENLDTGKREYIVEECEKAAELARKLQDSDKHFVIRKLAQNALKRIEKIKKVCEVDKYNLYFNGQVGVGKTTAISHLTGLIDGNCLEEDRKISEIPLLTVGGGRTTVCEMKIVPTKKQSRIVLSKMEGEEFDKYIEEFCCTLIEKDHKEQESPISIEARRFICNMAKFPKENGNVSKNQKDMETYMSEAGVSDEVIKNDLRQGLLEAVTRKIDYENRNQTEILFTEGRFEDWLKKTLSEINHGLFPGIPFAKELAIYINSENINFDIPDYIASIIDTRGMEAGSGIREDLVKQIEKETSISFMCDAVPALGGNSDILSLLKHTYDGSGKDLCHRIFLLGLEKNAQLEEVNGADNSREKGMKIKKDEAVEKFREADVALDEGHVIFYNTLFGLEYTSKNILMCIDKEKYNQEREQFWKELEKIIARMYEKYDIEISDISLDLKKMGSGQIVKEVVSKFDQCKAYVDRSQGNIEEHVSDFLLQLEKEIDSKHHGYIRGCVNRQGEYYNLDIYSVSSQIGGNEFRRKCGKERDILKRQVEVLFDESDETEKICRDAIENQIDMKYNDFFKQICEYYSNCVSECLKDNSLWNELNTYWGDGIGNYKRRVIDRIEAELVRQNFEEKLKLKNYFREYMIDIKSFLDISNQS